MEYNKYITDYIDANDEIYKKIAREIWQYAETGLQEFKSSELLKDKLLSDGFTIQNNVAGLPTAFTAEWGSGHPIIGILGEYDALAGLSQKVSSTEEPAEKGKAGHGCGHNLIGTAGIAAVAAVKKLLEKENLPGTIKFIGCPAEETHSSKVLMVKEGVFDDLDASLIWHPDFANATYYSSTLAMDSFKVNFHGRTAHAAGDPQAGRSALDAAILMDVGVNYLREHTIQEARIHCYISDGGDAPNIVPGYAQIHYIIRAPRRTDVEQIYARMQKIAQGAALMTETTCDTEFVCGTYNYLINTTINDAVAKNLLIAGPIEYTDEEKQFAEELKSSLGKDKIEHFLDVHKLNIKDFGGYLCGRIADDLHLKGFSINETVPVSGDRADVAYITPSAQFGTTCVPLGIAEHTWQFVASCGSEIGMKGMLLAARTLALTAKDLLTDTNLLEKAKEEHIKNQAGHKYVSPLRKQEK